MVYISDFGVGAAITLSYLQIVRGLQYTAQGGENSGTALTYWGNLCATITDLTKQVKDHFGVTVENPDAGPSAIVRVPSSRNLNCPYFAVLQREFPNAVDLSRCIRKGDVSSGDPNSTFDDVFNDYHVDNPDDITDFNENPTILLVDDVFSTGKSIASIIRRFEPHVPAETTYVLACPLRIVLTAAELGPLGIQIDSNPL
jgi:hypothetical protein